MIRKQRKRGKLAPLVAVELPTKKLVGIELVAEGPNQIFALFYGSGFPLIKGTEDYAEALLFAEKLREAAGARKISMEVEVVSFPNVNVSAMN